MVERIQITAEAFQIMRLEMTRCLQASQSYMTLSLHDVSLHLLMQLHQGTSPVSNFFIIFASDFKLSIVPYNSGNETSQLVERICIIWLRINQFGIERSLCNMATVFGFSLRNSRGEVAVRKRVQLTSEE